MVQILQRAADSASQISQRFKRLENLNAFKLATEFKLEVYKLITDHPRAERDFKYRGELREAVSSVESNLAEGWRRYRRRDMANFVRIAQASAEEAKVRLRDGIHRLLHRR